MRRIAIILWFLLLCGAAWALPTTYLDCAPHTMSTDTAPSPYVASASVEYLGSGGYGAYRAFNGVNTFQDAWIANTTGSVWIKIDLSTACKVYQYRLAPHEAARMPKTWIFEGSNDNSTWTTLDSQTNYTSWVDNIAQDFLINASVSYRYYRLTSSANNGDSTYTSIGEISLFQANTQAWPLRVTTSAYYNVYPGWLAFTGIVGNGGQYDWIVATTGSCWIKMDLGTATSFNTYEILPYEATRAPKTWVMEGSNDNSTWTTLDTRTNITSWVDQTSKIFTMSSPGSYTYYRLTSSANNGDSTYTSIDEMYFSTVASGAVRHKSQVF